MTCSSLPSLSNHNVGFSPKEAFSLAGHHCIILSFRFHHQEISASMKNKLNKQEKLHIKSLASKVRSKNGLGKCWVEENLILRLPQWWKTKRNDEFQIIILLSICFSVVVRRWPVRNLSLWEKAVNRCRARDVMPIKTAAANSMVEFFCKQGRGESKPERINAKGKILWRFADFCCILGLLKNVVLTLDSWIKCSASYIKRTPKGMRFWSLHTSVPQERKAPRGNWKSGGVDLGSHHTWRINLVIVGLGAWLLHCKLMDWRWPSSWPCQKSKVAGGKVFTVFSVSLWKRFPRILVDRFFFESCFQTMELCLVEQKNASRFQASGWIESW